MTDQTNQIPAVIAAIERSRITAAILDFVSDVPTSKVGGSPDPASEARTLASRAAQRAALTAGSLALPPGPLGWLTLLPELIAIWKIQGQMVSDIAATYGRNHSLGREQMLWCLFRHTAAQAFRDLVVQVGDRLIFRRMSYGVTERVAKQVGIKLTQRTLSKGISRWLPVIGALGVGAYAYYDTGQVASTAIALFEGDIAMEEMSVEAAEEEPTPKAKPKPAAKTAKNSIDRAAGVAARKIASGARKATGRNSRKPDRE